MRFMFVIAALSFLIYIANDRLSRFNTNNISRERNVEPITEPMFETALCFGPRYSIDSLALYDYWNKPESRNDSTWPLYDMEIQNFTDKDVRTLHDFRRFFVEDFRWQNDSLYKVGLHMLYKVIGEWRNNTDSLLPIFKHALPPDASFEGQSIDFFSFHYSMCINYTYNMTIPADGKEISHSIYLKDSQVSHLLGDGIFAYYADVFFYHKGTMTEFPLVHDIMPYRADMSPWIRVRGVVRKSVHVRTRKNPCVTRHERPTYSFTKCFTWCLRRALLNSVNCTIPQLDTYIFDMTSILDMFVRNHQKLRPGQSFESMLDSIGDFRTNTTYFNKLTARPGMHDFSHMLPCMSALDFRYTFKEFRRTFYPRSEDKNTAHEWCRRECPSVCEKYSIHMSSEGVQEHHTSKHGGRAPLGVTIIFPKTMMVTREKWLYMWQQLFIDMSGVMSFLLGMSVLTMYEWLYFLINWYLSRFELVEIDQSDVWAQYPGEDYGNGDEYYGGAYEPQSSQYFDDYSDENHEDDGGSGNEKVTDGES